MVFFIFANNELFDVSYAGSGSATVLFRSIQLAASNVTIANVDTYNHQFDL